MLDSTKAISKGRVDTRSRFTSTVENVLSTCTRWSSDKPSVSFRSSTLTSSLKPSEDSTEDFMRSVPRRWSMTILWKLLEVHSLCGHLIDDGQPFFRLFLQGVTCEIQQRVRHRQAREDRVPAPRGGASRKTPMPARAGSRHRAGSPKTTAPAMRELRLGRVTLTLGESVELRLDGFKGYPPEIVPLAPRDDRERYLVYFRRRKDEDRVSGRLFEGLQQRVEGRLGQHVDLVDDVDLVPALVGRVPDLVRAGRECRRCRGCWRRRSLLDRANGPR